ncbi:hypothetical protein [Niabella hirudinis]
MKCSTGKPFTSKKIASFNGKQAQRAVDPYNDEPPKPPVAAARQ